MSDIPLGQRVAQIRAALGISQSELGRRSGLQTSAISQFETGARLPSCANLIRLADALHTSADWLLGR